MSQKVLRIACVTSDVGRLGGRYGRLPTPQLLPSPCRSLYTQVKRSSKTEGCDSGKHRYARWGYQGSILFCKHCD
uniref:Uncharacterized protein n=1 Tax=Anopheles albimanus TaxID=7167 RepID=A0A8W7K5F8_ANOAL